MKGFSFDFGDIDNDSDFDFLISGYGFDGYQTILYENKRLLDEDGLIVQLNDNIVFKAEASELSSMSLFRNGSLINQQNNTKILTSNIDVSILRNYSITA